ncbi:hypothetical protein [Streptomyces hiroshimensis]|uniref:Uncharacterized protein n=1 Tax=Streptomyces hiroshimensis TaxID=66424 RepID=A0ABQ2Z8H3_9ACTN|nr:hypothetical protein GCM10010324_63740 [Streptomyces hiroshimensis]
MTADIFAGTGSSRNPVKCYHSNALQQNAVLYRKDLGIEKSFAEVLSPADIKEPIERRQIICVKSGSRRLLICSAYLTSGNESFPLNVRRKEAAAAKALLARAEYAGYTKFLGGDFDDDPLSAVADNFYDPGYGRGAHGTFKETDSPCGNTIKEGEFVGSVYIWCRSGEATHDSGDKFDYLFVPPSVHVTSSDATSSKVSDHKPLWAEVTL